MTDISYYLQMSYEELNDERRRLLDIDRKILTEWLQFKQQGYHQYELAAKANLRRLRLEIRTLMSALKSHDDCETKASFDKRRRAAYKAAQLRKQNNIPTLTYYKCPRCKMYHLTSNGGQIAA